MKTELRDYLLSALSISLILVLTLLLISSLRSLVFSCFAEYSPIVHAIIFFFLYGLITACYLNILRKTFPFRAGSFAMNHPQFALWKHHAVVGELGKLALGLFFPVFLRPIYYSLLGAKVGKNVAIGGVITDPMLTKIQDHAIIGQDSVITSHTIVRDKIFLEAVYIEQGATIGINAVIMPGVVVGKNSVVAPGAIVLMDTKIPPNEFWGGVPAKKIKNIEPPVTESKG
jgi:acetyltransferase-like isoleucine patch superfamily enzyme